MQRVRLPVRDLLQVCVCVCVCVCFVSVKGLFDLIILLSISIMPYPYRGVWNFPKSLINTREGGGYLGVMLIRVCGPVFLNLPQSYTWPSKHLTYSYTLLYTMLTYLYAVL